MKNALLFLTLGFLLTTLAKADSITSTQKEICDLARSIGEALHTTVSIEIHDRPEAVAAQKDSLSDFLSFVSSNILTKPDQSQLELLLAQHLTHFRLQFTNDGTVIIISDDINSSFIRSNSHIDHDGPRVNTTVPAEQFREAICNLSSLRSFIRSRTNGKRDAYNFVYMDSHEQLCSLSDPLASVICDSSLSVGANLTNLVKSQGHGALLWATFSKDYGDTIDISSPTYVFVQK